MSYIKTGPIKNSTIMLLFSEKDNIKMDPPYQRMGGVWTAEKKQLLIDSILNDYDIPKIYFHILDAENSSPHSMIYSVIDGRQRLETIFDFINGKFYLSRDFEYQRDTSIKLAGLNYDDIAQKYPRIKIQFDSFILPVVGVETDDEELIEDMFSRLNEAVPLNSAEKRNAIGGEVVKSIRYISEHSFFVQNVCFSNKRYQHREVSARLLLIEDCLSTSGRLLDTKKNYLDALAKKYYRSEDVVVKLQGKVLSILDAMSKVFGDADPLLRAQGNIVVYYLLFKQAIDSAMLDKITRTSFIEFNESLRANRENAKDNYDSSSFELLEYDRLTQQGTNDASNIKERLKILCEYMNIPN